MRHRKANKHFNRSSNARKSLFKNLVRSLVLHGEVTTNEARAKELKRVSDKLIHQAQGADVNTRRVLHQYFGARDVVNTLVERVAPATKGKTSGFSRLSIVGSRRGDNTKLVKIELINKAETLETLKSGKPPMKRVKAAAKPKAVAQPKVAAKPKAAATKKKATPKK